MRANAFQVIDEIANATRRMRVASVAIIFFLAPTEISTGRAAEASSAQVAPQVQEQGINDLAKENPVTQWKPGDPVRIVPDLRESGDASQPPAIVEMQPPQPLKPIVHPPVAPEVTEQRTDRLPTVKPYQEGQPVRIVPDLRESNGGN